MEDNWQKPYPDNCIHDQKVRMNMLKEHNEETKVNTDPSRRIELLVKKVIKWHRDRNLIKGSTDKDQVLKLAQELGELSDSVCKGEDIKDDIGDMLVVMINICERNNVTILDCLTTAHNDIKHRKGRMVDGIFVKEDTK